MSRRKETACDVPGGATAVLSGAEGPRDAEAGLVLVVEGDGLARLCLGKLLALVGFRCLVARDAGEALDLLASRRPSLAVLGTELPGGGGTELGWTIRCGRPEISLVAVTSDPKTWHCSDLTELGFDYVFGSPFDRGEFVKRCLELGGGAAARGGNPDACPAPLPRG